MRIFSNLPLIFTLSVAALCADASAQSAAKCEDMARDVSAAILKDGAKTLLIVEDALVINESCAADIIRAAILASRADDALVNQIVQAGISVAPKMAGVITEAADSVAPGAVARSAEAVASAPMTSAKNSGKEVLPVLDKNPITVVDKNPIVVEQEEEFVAVSSSIRGIYLIQPPPTGAPPCDKKRKCDNVPTSPCGCTPAR